MSAAEIADNKWELESTKAPTATPTGLAQIVMFGGFALFFGWIIAFSVVGIVTPKPEDGGLAGQYKNMKAAGAGEAEAAPAEE
jgi:hypothetical protein